MQNTLVIPFNIDVVSTLSITLLISFQIHICRKKRLANSKFYGLQSSRCEIKKCEIKTSFVADMRMVIHDNFGTQTWNLVSSLPSLGFVSSNPDSPNGTLHIRLYIPVHFIHIIFPPLFLMFSEFIFHRKSLRLPCHLRYHKGFVKFSMGLKVFSSQIMYGRVTFKGQGRMTQAMTISSKRERSRWLKTRDCTKNGQTNTR